MVATRPFGLAHWTSIHPRPTTTPIQPKLESISTNLDLLSVLSSHLSKARRPGPLRRSPPPHVSGFIALSTLGAAGIDVAVLLAILFEERPACVPRFRHVDSLK